MLFKTLILITTFFILPSCGFCNQTSDSKIDNIHIDKKLTEDIKEILESFKEIEIPKIKEHNTQKTVNPCKIMDRTKSKEDEIKIFFENGRKVTENKAESQVKSNYFRSDSKPDIHIAISSSIPMGTLKAYISQIEELRNQYNVSLELNGFIQTAKKIGPTLDFVNNLLRNSLKEIEININPELFLKHNITRVPTFIYEDGDTEYLISGAVRLDDAVYQIEKFLP